MMIQIITANKRIWKSLNISPQQLPLKAVFFKHFKQKHVGSQLWWHTSWRTQPEMKERPPEPSHPSPPHIRSSKCILSNQSLSNHTPAPCPLHHYSSSPCHWQTVLYSSDWGNKWTNWEPQKVPIFPTKIINAYNSTSYYLGPTARQLSTAQFSRSVVSDSLQPHEPQHARPPCPSPTPGVHPKPCPLSRWCHPTILSSAVPFSSCPQSFPASGSFQMSQLFAAGGQSIGVSASTSVLPVNTQDWSPLGWTGWICLQSKGLSRVFSNITVQKELSNHHLTQSLIALWGQHTIVLTV